MESTAGMCTRGDFGELLQDSPTKRSNYADRLLYGHSQCLMSRRVILDRHHGWDDQPGK